MTNAELLIEAIEYAQEDNTDWWDNFKSINEAKRTIRLALSEDVEESQIICLLSALDIDVFDSYTIEEAYKSTLYKLLKEIEEE